MRWGLDAAYPPSTEDASQQLMDGYSWFAGYVGGAAENVWTADDWQCLAAVGFALLPIWVAPLIDDAGLAAGREDGRACMAALAQLGLKGVVALDVESGLMPKDYARGFLLEATGVGCAVVLYGTATTIRALGELNWSAWWLAFWPKSGQLRPTGQPDWTFWQFATGPQADYNCCVDDAPFALLQSPEAPSAQPSAEA